MIFCVNNLTTFQMKKKIMTYICMYKLEKTKLNQSTKVFQSDTKYVNFMLLNLKPRAKTANEGRNLFHSVDRARLLYSNLSSLKVSCHTVSGVTLLCALCARVSRFCLACQQDHVRAPLHQTPSRRIAWLFIVPARRLPSDPLIRLFLLACFRLSVVGREKRESERKNDGG